MTNIQSPKLESDLSFVMQALYEVLTELDLKELLPFIPFLKSNSRNTQDLPPWVPAQSKNLVQLFSLSFQLLNMVEENVAIQLRRSSQANGHLETEAGLWPWALKRLKDFGFKENEILSVVRQLQVEPVLTAHPTESKRTSILSHHRDFYLQLVKRENQMWTPIEKDWHKEEMKATLEMLWRTAGTFVQRPDVSSEIQNVMHYLKNVFPNLLPWLDKRFQKAWEECGFSEELDALEREFPKFQLGTWVGGDRDGHPFVSSDITQKALMELRLNALILLRHKLIDLAKKLSLANPSQGVPQTLTEHLSNYQQKFPELFTRAVSRNPGESLRNLVQIMIDRLPIEIVRDHATHLKEVTTSYRHPAEVMDDLHVLTLSLRNMGAHRLANSEVRDVVRFLETYGFHSARLDIRQNSRFHEAALKELLTLSGLTQTNQESDWSEEGFKNFIRKEMQNPRPFTLRTQKYEQKAKEIMECLQVFLDYRQRFGGEGLGSYIVSMTRSVEDLYTVFLLAREAGLAQIVDGHLICPIHVVPLFETIKDLENSAEILDSFLAHPVTKASLQYQMKEFGLKTPQQQIMLGYSDSCKDGGILASQWHLYRAQKELTSISNRHGIQLCFFHGRGGTVSRGAGPVHRFVESTPPGSLQGSFRMTEQGETIARKYANQATAVYNLELLLASVTSETLIGTRKPQQEPRVSEIMEILASESFNKYRELISRNDFMTFYRQATPIDVLEQYRIGSRPSKRTGSTSLEDLRAIPWVFSWNQSRFYLPSWYGVGSALSNLEQKYPEYFEILCNNLNKKTLLNYVLHNVETTVASAHEEIMLAYANLIEDSNLRSNYMNSILDELRLTKKYLVRIFGSSIDVRRPGVVKTITLREPSLDFLHKMQIHHLREWRKTDASEDQKREDLLEKLFATVNAIAGGLRNTG